MDSYVKLRFVSEGKKITITTFLIASQFSRGKNHVLCFFVQIINLFIGCLIWNAEVNGAINSRPTAFKQRLWNNQTFYLFFLTPHPFETGISYQLNKLRFKKMRVKDL